MMTVMCSGLGACDARRKSPRMCLVCNAPASGMHYGVMSCHSCKAFFRRSVGKEEELRCKKNMYCYLVPSNRTMCSKCRYQKCVVTGMALKPGVHKNIPSELTTRDLPPLLKVTRSQEDITAVQLAFIVQYDTSGQAYGHILDNLPVENKEHFAKLAESMIEENAQEVVRFAQQVPCFNLLTKRDRAELVKKSMPFLKVLSVLPHVDVNHRTLSTSSPLTKDVHVDVHEKGVTSEICNVDVTTLAGREMGELLLRASKRMQKLRLNEHEQDQVKALVLFSQDLCVLDEPEKVETIQNSVLDTLLLSLERHHQGHRLIFPRIISLLTDLRTNPQIPEEHLLTISQQFQRHVTPHLQLSLNSSHSPDYGNGEPSPMSLSCEFSDGTQHMNRSSKIIMLD